MAVAYGYTINHQTLEAMRITAVRMVQRGIRVEDIAAGMQLHRSTIFGWLHKYQGKGLRALKSTKAPGARPKLTQKQIFRLIAMLRQPAVKYGFGSDLWTGPRVKALIHKKFGVVLRGEYMPRFLRRLGLVRRSPERRALEQNPKAVRKWKRSVLPTITRLAAQCRGIILYGDESLFVLIPHLGKTWTFPNMRPIVRVSGKRGVHVGVTSAVSSKGHLVFQLSKGNFKATTLIRFMKALHKHFINRKLFFIIDGAPAHRSKLVRQFAQDNGSWLSLHYLPGYSPELNPDEDVWNIIKTQKLTAKPIKDKKQLQSEVIGSLRSLQKHPERVKTFFKKST